MILNELFLHFLTSIALLLRILSSVILLFFFLPLQVKESRIKNGLQKLRIQLLVLGTCIFLINAVSIITLAQIVFSDVHQTFMTCFFQFFNGVGFMVVSIVCYLIYHSQYSEESLQRHEQIQKMEDKQASQKQ